MEIKMKKKSNFINGKQYAIITGASQGLGKSFAYEAAKRGWNLILCALPESGLPQVTEDIRSYFLCDVLAIECDLVDREDRDNFVREVTSKKLPVTLLVNNAGIADPYQGPVESAAMKILSTAYLACY